MTSKDPTAKCPECCNNVDVCDCNDNFESDHYEPFEDDGAYADDTDSD